MLNPKSGVDLSHFRYENKKYICTNNSTHPKYTDNLICDNQQQFIFGRIPITLFSFFAIQEMTKTISKMLIRTVSV